MVFAVSNAQPSVCVIFNTNGSLPCPSVLNGRE